MIHKKNNRTREVVCGEPSDVTTCLWDKVTCKKCLKIRVLVGKARQKYMKEYYASHRQDLLERAREYRSKYLGGV